MTSTKDLLVASPNPLWTSKAPATVGVPLEDLECGRCGAVMGKITLGTLDMVSSIDFGDESDTVVLCVRCST